MIKNNLLYNQTKVDNGYHRWLIMSINNFLIFSNLLLHHRYCLPFISFETKCQRGALSEIIWWQLFGASQILTELSFVLASIFNIVNNVCYSSLNPPFPSCFHIFLLLLLRKLREYTTSCLSFWLNLDHQQLPMGSLILWR